MRVHRLAEPLDKIMYGHGPEFYPLRIQRAFVAVGIHYVGNRCRIVAAVKAETLHRKLTEAEIPSGIAAVVQAHALKVRIVGTKLVNIGYHEVLHFR